MIKYKEIIEFNGEAVISLRTAICPTNKEWAVLRVVITNYGDGLGNERQKRVPIDVHLVGDHYLWAFNMQWDAIEGDALPFARTQGFWTDFLHKEENWDDRGGFVPNREAVRCRLEDAIKENVRVLAGLPASPSESDGVELSVSGKGWPTLRVLRYREVEANE